MEEMSKKSLATEAQSVGLREAATFEERGSAEAVAAKKVACVALLAQTWARRAVRDFSLVAFQNVTPESRSKEITHGRAPSKVLWTPFEIHDAAERIGSSSIRSIH